MEKYNIGSKLKKLREFRKISIEDLALNANMDVSQIEYIEKKGVVPSLGHLIKISRSLGVRLGTFLDDQQQIGPVVNRSGDEKTGLRFSAKNENEREHLNFFSLAHDKSGRHMEPFIVEIEPKQESSYKLSSHEGEEFIYVLNGEVEINYGKEVFILKEGDSIYLDSVVSHNVHAATDKAAKILVVVYTPV